MKNDFILAKAPRKKLNYFGIYLLISKKLLTLKSSVDFIDPIDHIMKLNENIPLSNLEEYNPVYLGKYELCQGKNLKIILPTKIYNQKLIPVQVTKKSIFDYCHLPILGLPLVQKTKICLLIKKNELVETKLGKLDITHYNISIYNPKLNLENYVLLDLPELNNLINE